IYDNLKPETRQLLEGSANPDRLRSQLAADLNMLLDRELQTRKRLSAVQQKKSAVDQKVADGNTSEGVRRDQDELSRQIAELGKISPLYDAERFKQVQLSQYLQEFIQQNPQSHSR